MSQGIFARVRPVVLSVAVAALALGAEPAAPPITDWSNIETVIVHPDVGGPALWHIAAGASEVWILPTVSPVPEDMSWDTQGIADTIKGSNVVLLPPSASVGLAEGLWFYMWHMDTLEEPDGTTMESTLPDALRARFVAARGRANKDADRYDKYLPAVAAMMLEGDYFKAVNLSYKEPQRTIEHLASRAGVSTHQIADYPAMDIIHDVPKMSPAAHRVCIEDALADIDTLAAHGVAAAHAWAAGDIAGIKANYSETRLDSCLSANAAYLALRQRSINDEVAAIQAALKKPGKTFAVIPLGFFLRKGGVLERLQAAGLTVTAPE
jgi:uncharacterized protein YbaP (TraB family)